VPFFLKTGEKGFLLHTTVDYFFFGQILIRWWLESLPEDDLALVSKNNDLPLSL
jgi:hypothetical protein